MTSILGRSPRGAIAMLLVAASLGFLLTVSSPARGETPKEADGDSKPAKGAAKETPKEPAEKPLKAADIKPEMLVPPKEADAKAQLRFIRKIEAMRPEFESEAEAEKFLKTSRDAIIKSADKILAGKPNEEQESAALQSKLQAHQFLVIVGLPGALEEGLKFAAKLKADKRPKIAEMGEVTWLDFKMAMLPSSDKKERLEIIDALAAALAKKPQAYIEFAMHIGRMLETMDDGETAVAAYEKFGAILSKNLNEQIRDLGEHMKGGSARRAKLLTGEPLKISGTLTTGKPFDLKEYEGKVILVDFWATWCGPCIAEMPNVKANYEKYHSKGFEVVGVALDDDKQAVTNFLKENEIPWKTLFSDDPVKKGMHSPLAEYYGITGIPTVMLVDRKGKVVSLAARDERLGSMLEKLLGPAPPEKDK